jgi:hypothetical protein
MMTRSSAGIVPNRSARKAAPDDPQPASPVRTPRKRVNCGVRQRRDPEAELGVTTMPGTRLFKGRIPAETAAFIRKYGLRPDRYNIPQIHCGLHSGIPECCVLFFLTCWPIIRRDEDETGEPSVYRVLVWEAETDSKGYIPCPACLASRRFVELRECDRGKPGRGLREFCRLKRRNSRTAPGNPRRELTAPCSRRRRRQVRRRIEVKWP